MVICDFCKKEISNTDEEYVVTISRKECMARYDCCSQRCVAYTLSGLSEEWNKNSGD